MTKLIKNNGDGRFLILKPFVSNTYDTWEISTRLALPETTITECTLLNTVVSDQEVKCLKLLLNANGSVTLQVSTENNDYSETSTEYFEANKLYYIKIIFDSHNYIISYSTDGTSYTDMGLLITTDDTCSYTANQYINFIPTDNNKYFNGSLDIDSTKIKYTISGTETTLFNGAVASPTGVYQVGNVTTNGFTVNDYYICNALTLKTNNIKLISKVSISSLPANNTSQPIFVNRDGQGIYIENINSSVSFRFRLDNSTAMVEPITGITTGSYWLGLSYNGSTYNFYVMKDESFYTLQTLPRFEEGEATCIKQWVGSYINSTDNVFKEDLLIGSDASTTAFNGTIDLTNTILSNNVVNYTVNKLSYLPNNGTRLLDSDATVSSITLPTLYKVTLVSEDSSGYPQDINIKIDFNSIINNYNNYYQKISDTEVYVPAGTILYDSGSNLISNNVQNDITYTVTLYAFNIFPDVRTVIGMTVRPRTSVSVSNSYQNSYIIIDEFSGEYLVPSGSDVTYTVSGPEGSEGYVTTTQTVSNVTTDTEETPRLKYKNEFINIHNSGQYTVRNILSTIHVAGPNTTNYKFTLHGDSGKLYGNFGGYAQASYAISGGSTINLLAMDGGALKEHPGYTGTDGVGVGITVNNTPLLFAGGSATGVESSSLYGGGGYAGGVGRNGNGVSYNGSISVRQNDPTLNANGGMLNFSYGSAYGGSGNAFTVTGVTELSTPTLLANDASYTYNEQGSDISAYIMIEEL
jgi:hypothetical protein